MKKNWLPIALLVGFIIAWQFLVLNPYQDKQRKLLEAQKASQSLATPQPANPTAATPTAVGASQALSAVATPLISSNFLSDDEKKSFQEVSLNNKRSVKVFSNGAIGAAVFTDYNKREQKEIAPITLMSDAFRWSSTDADIQNCIAQLKAAPNSLLFSATVAQGECQLQYSPDSTKPGLISAKLLLKGFEKSQGFIELRGSDLLGSSVQQDQSHLVYFLDESKKDLRDKKLFEVSTPIQGKVSWIAWGDRYFASVLLPKGNYNPNIIHGPAVGAKIDPKLDPVFFGFQYPIVNQGKEVVYDLDFLFSTRDSSFLSSIRPDLEKSVELGFFPSIARALIFALNLINKGVGNYGVAIIVLTLFARLAFWPLNKKVFESGRKMKALAPEMEKIKAKYGNDKSKAQQMNVEVMGLYKKHGVNPMGSCLPMLLQLPIWFGLYQALNHSLDLYQAPFFGWIVDLSARDPFFVFPTLWTISLVVYIWINPTPQQPGQPDMRWMMLAMNVFFGFMSASWPAGLTLYLFVSNLVGIIQQLMMTRASKKLQPIQEGA